MTMPVQIAAAAVGTAEIADGAVTAAKLAAGVGGGGGGTGITGELILTDYGTTSLGGSALNAAIAALPATGGIIRVPAGTWTIDVAVQFTKSNIIIAGVGSGSVFQFNGTTVTTAFKMDSATGRAVFLRDFSILQTSAGNAGIAIDATYFQRGEIRNVSIAGSTSSANAPVGCILFAGGGGASGSYYNVVDHCRVQMGGASSYGIKFDNVANSNTVRDVRVLGASTGTGIVVNAHAIMLERIDIETGLLVGIDVQALGHDCTIIAPYAEGNQTNIKLASGVEATTIIGGVVIDGTTANISNLGAKGLNIVGLRANFAGGGNYEPMTFRTDVSGLATRRWMDTAFGGFGGTSLAFGQNVGSVATWSMVAIDVPETIYTDALAYTVGSVTNGNVRAALWGPATVDDSGASLTLVASSASTAQAAALSVQVLAWSTPLTLRPGRYYLGIMSDSLTATYLGFAGPGTITDSTGRNGYFVNSGGYTTPTNPSASGWVANGFRPPMLRLRCAAPTSL